MRSTATEIPPVLESRRPVEGQGRLAGVVILAALVLGVLAAPLVPAVLRPCPLLTHLGLPCGFCGGTRAMVALGQGDLLAALQFNPLAVVALCAAAGCGVLLGLGRRIEAAQFARWLWVGIGLFLVNWVYLIFYLPG